MSEQHGGEGRRGLTVEQRAQRRESRAAQTYAAFLGDLEKKGLARPLAEKTAQAVLCALEQRLMDSEARHLEAQLPLKMRALLQRCPRHAGQPPRKFGRAEFLRVIADELGCDVDEAERLARAVLTTVRDHISEGEAEDVIGQLPQDLRTLWVREA
jgi:uncharacterized protein (DUF2267 family)